MTTHKLKIWPEHFDAVADGSKRFELREDDRGFKVGDTLHLREWKPVKGVPYHGFYLGRELRCRVTFIMHVSLYDSGIGSIPGCAVMSIADVEVTQ